MEFSIWLPKDYYGYEKANRRPRARKITINPGYTALVGPNGSGKTTFLRQIAAKCREAGYTVVYYDNMSDGGNSSMQRALMDSRIDFLSQLALGSEGEGIFANIGELASKIGRACYNARGRTPVFVLMDGIDSGLSIDKIQVVRKDLIDFAINVERQNGNDNLYIICTANNYELSKGAAQLNVCNTKYVNLDTYTKFSRFIISNSEHKEELGYVTKKKVSKTKGSKSRSGNQDH